MKKLLIGLATGFALGTGMCYYTQKPQQQEEKPAPTIQSECDCGHANYQSTKTIPENTLLQKLDMTDEQLESYGKQLYKEMYNGECVDMNRFLNIKEKLKEIYERYGFEKAKEVYNSFKQSVIPNYYTDYKARYTLICDFGTVSSYDLAISAALIFPLEEYCKIDGYSYREGALPDDAPHDCSIIRYLSESPRETRESYINDICEGKDRLFTDPSVLSKGSLCREIAINFPEELLNSTSIATATPELELALEYEGIIAHAVSRKNEVCHNRYEWTSEEYTECTKKPIEEVEEYNMKLAEIICARYKMSDSGSLKEYVKLADQNIELIKKILSYDNYAFMTSSSGSYAKKLCGKNEEEP